MRKVSWTLALMTGAFLSTASTVMPAGPFDEVIEERHQLMHDIGDANKAMRTAADPSVVAANADKLAEALARINAETFPKGSSDGSRAKPEIWERWDEFTATAENAVQLARNIASKARAGDAAAVSELVKDFGRNACGSCHRPFRKPKQRH